MNEPDPVPRVEGASPGTTEPDTRTDDRSPSPAPTGASVGEPPANKRPEQGEAASADVSKGPAIKDVRSLEGLLVYAYGRSGRFSIPPTVRDAIAEENAPVVDLRPRIHDLASQDPLLKVPVRILAAVDRAHGSLRFRRRCLSAVALALLANSSLRGVAGLDSALLYSDQGDPAVLLEDVASGLRSGNLQPPGSGENPMKEVDRRELAENGVLAVALYLALQREWSDADLVRQLEVVLWADGYRNARSAKRESPKALLVEAAPGALGTVTHACRADVEAAEAQAATADRMRRYADEERAEAVRLQGAAEAESDRLRSLLAESEETITRLQDAIAREQQARHVQSSHAVDDYENLRTRVIRLIDRQLTLLEDGLHALRNGSTGVTEEYLERVIDAFVNQANSLREANPPEGEPK